MILKEVGIGDPYAPLRQDEIDDSSTGWPWNEPDLTAGPVIDRCDRVFAVAAGHSLAARPPVTAEDLADLEMAWVPPSVPTALYDALIPPRTPSGRPIRRTQQVEGLHHTLARVASGGMVHLTVASLPLAQRADISLIPITGLPPLPLGLIWCTTTRRPHPRARATAVAMSSR